jgi:ComF family protein
MSLLNKILDQVFSLIFPDRCLGCGTGDSLLCVDCLRNMPPAERPTESWIYPAYDYRHKNLRRALWLFKYRNRRRLAQIIAPSIYERLIEEMADLRAFHNFTDPLLVPIPLSLKRARQRGYNQAEIIAKEIQRISNWELVSGVLIKTRETASQAKTKNKKERLGNLKGSFGIKNPEKIKGRNIILVDDIVTTGATLNEARKTLKQSGAKNVIALTAAH